MSDELIFGEDVPYEETRPPSPFFSPPVCAVAAFALAATGLLGQSVLSAALSVLFGPQFSTDGSMTTYYVVMGAGMAAQGVLAVLLAVRAVRSGIAWEANLARAAVLVSAVSLVAGVATVVGAVIHRGPVD
jgi:hypothetical protein